MGTKLQGIPAQRISKTSKVCQSYSPRGMKGICKQIVSARSHTALLNTEGYSGLYSSEDWVFQCSQSQQYWEFKLLNDTIWQPKASLNLVWRFPYDCVVWKGLIYSWGGNFRQNGTQKRRNRRNHQTKRQENRRYCLWRLHSVALDNDGRVYSEGSS